MNNLTERKGLVFVGYVANSVPRIPAIFVNLGKRLVTGVRKGSERLNEHAQGGLKNEVW